MKRQKIITRLGLVAAGLALAISSAHADDALMHSSEDVSLRGFALQHPLCREWSDGCTICKRDETGAAHCSTPGIACQPEAIRCRRATTK